jgi:hypothetical protein
VIRILAGEAVVLAALALVAADLSAHKHVENVGGLNIRGYRGPIAHEQRQPNELRVVFAGGTRAFGWGEPPGSTIPASVRFELSRVLDVRGRAVRPIVAINLGTLAGDASSYAATLEHFSYLAPDYVGIVDDLGERGPNRPFAVSGVYRLTGYQPMLPLVLEEKGRVTSTRVIGAPLEYAGGVLEAADRGLASLSGAADRDGGELEPAAYAKAMTGAIDAAHRQARGVVVALAPAETDRQARNRAALSGALGTLGSPAWLRVVDLQNVPELSDRSLRLDGFNFGATATSIAAEAIAPAFLTLIQPR